jgi:manganese/iron transport system permease protein
MLDGLIEPLQYSFMQRSLIVAILVGLICAVVGSYLMVQRLALLGDAIGHSVLLDWHSLMGLGRIFLWGLLLPGS